MMSKHTNYRYYENTNQWSASFDIETLEGDLHEVTMFLNDCNKYEVELESSSTMAFLLNEGDVNLLTQRLNKEKMFLIALSGLEIDQ